MWRRQCNACAILLLIVARELWLRQNGTNWIFVVRRCPLKVQREAEKPYEMNVSKAAVAIIAPSERGERMIYCVFVFIVPRSLHSDSSEHVGAVERCKFFSSRSRCTGTQQEKKSFPERYLFTRIHRILLFHFPCLHTQSTVRDWVWVWCRVAHNTAAPIRRGVEIT